MDRDALQILLARGLSVEAIAARFGRHPSTVEYWMLKHELEAVHADKHAAKGSVERERLEAYVEAGLTTRAIAAELGTSQTNIRYWLRRHGLRTRGNGSRRAGTRGKGSWAGHSSS